MTPEQHKQFTTACETFGEAISKIFATETPTLERQPTWTVKSNCATDEPARDWEILEIRPTNKHANQRILRPLRPSHPFWDEYRFLYGDSSVKSGHWYIHSVRRLSDNSVWTVGDEVNVNNYSKGTIQGFKIDEQTGVMLAKRLNLGYIAIERLTKPPSLHTTADGIQVTKDQKLYSFLSSGEIQTYSTWEDSSDKYYSEEAAKAAHKKWFYEQPVLSLFDLLSVGFFDGQDFKGAKELARQKLATR